MNRRRARTPAGTLRCGDWLFTPEGAAVHPGERTAVIADVHLGYEWARGAAGDCVPAHSLEETATRIAAVLERVPIARLIVAGDLVESPRPCARTAGDVRRLNTWLESRGVTLTILEGNHDRGLKRRMGPTSPMARPSRPASGHHRLTPSCTIGGWTIAHGHRPIYGERTVSGHFHPVLRAEGFPARCFLAGPDRIILPAFSSNAAGCDVLTGPLPADWLERDLRCIASTGSELLDFGTLSTVRRR